MKDPSGAIYDAFITKLSALTYGGKTVPVYRSLSEVNKGDYVLLDYLEFTDDIDSSSFDSNCTMRIEILCGPYWQQGYNSKVFAISSSLMQLVVKQPIIVTGFTVDVTPSISSSRNYEMRDKEEKGIYKIKEIILKFHVEEN